MSCGGSTYPDKVISYREAINIQTQSLPFVICEDHHPKISFKSCPTSQNPEITQEKEILKPPKLDAKPK